MWNEILEIKRIGQHPELIGQAAVWFSGKWGIPAETYANSMRISAAGRDAVPQWYVGIDHTGTIAAGAGVIQNDFHRRTDLYPNLCALYVEPAWRKQGIARALLDMARRDVGCMGYPRLYLVTDHEKFYERCGWEFLTMTEDEDSIPIRLYMAPAL